MIPAVQNTMNQTPQSDNKQLGFDSVRPQRWKDMGGPAFIKIAILAALAGWFFHIEINKTVHRWIFDSSWSHGFLIPVFSIYFLHQNRHKIFELTPRPSWFCGLGAMLFLLVLNFLNTVQFKIAYGEDLILLAFIGAIVLFVGGWAILKQTWLPIAYLFFAIPLPGRLYTQITQPMQRLAAQTAAVVLNTIPELEATLRGVVIDVLYRGQPLEPSLQVAEACSGMRLLMAFVALGVAMAYLHWRPVWQRAVLLLSTVPIAILCNVIRVLITAMIYIFWDRQYAQGIYHDLLGMAMLPLAFLFYGLLAWLMSNLFVDENQQSEEVIIVRRTDRNVSGEQR
jgi:exosortase